MNQTPPPPLVHERRPRGSRRCTELELNVVVVHGTSRNPMITKRAVVHETRLLRGFANRTAGRAFRFAAAEEPTELNSWLRYNIQRSDRDPKANEEQPVGIIGVVRNQTPPARTFACAPLEEPRALRCSRD